MPFMAFRICQCSTRCWLETTEGPLRDSESGRASSEEKTLKLLLNTHLPGGDPVVGLDMVPLTQMGMCSCFCRKDWKR